MATTRRQPTHLEDHRNGYRGRRPQLDYEVSFAGKASVSDVLSRTRPATLRRTSTSPGPGVSTNRLIHGDNLPVLRNLIDDDAIRGKVRLVYIDPPYGTRLRFTARDGSAAYDDALDGAAYLSFLQERLFLLRELLSDDGSIYVHLDNKMAFAVKILMDEMFGPRNFRNWISRKKSNPKNSTTTRFGNVQDFILFYSKGSSYVWNRPLSDNGVYSHEQRFPRVESGTDRRYALVPIYGRGERNGATGQPWKGMNPPAGKHWLWTPDKLDKLDATGQINWSASGNPRRKIYADERPRGTPVQDIWLEFQDERNQMIDSTKYPTEKHIGLVERIVSASSNEGDLVIDAFLGAGTTAVAATRLRRFWIGIDSSATAIDVADERLQREYDGPEGLLQPRLLTDGEQHPTLGHTSFRAVSPRD